jgi:hypothetical protein
MFSITNYVLRILFWVVACRPVCYSSKCSVFTERHGIDHWDLVEVQ